MSAASVVKEAGLIAITPVHARIIEFGELDRLDAAFSAAVTKRFPGVEFTLEMRRHDNLRLHLAGDRMRIAVRRPQCENGRC